MENFEKLLERLYDEYRDRFYAAAHAVLQSREAAEDAISETFLRLIENRGKLESLNEQDTVSYAKTVLKNVSIDMLRRRSKYSDKELPDDVSAGGSAADIAEDNAAYLALLRLIREMPESLRQALFLKLNYGFKPKQIAKALGISHSAARKRLSDAYRLIKNFKEADRNE